MPYRVICKNCNFVLHSGELSPPNDILLKFGCKCPNCGRKLQLFGVKTKDKKTKPKEWWKTVGKPPSKTQEQTPRTLA